jgi:hypothetical protein
MADTQLAAALAEYSKQLLVHMAALRERHEGLEKAWANLREIYEGEGAQVFGATFEAASAKLVEYGSQGALIERQLQARIDELRAFEAADSEL